MANISFNFTQPSYWTFVHDVYFTATKSWNDLDHTHTIPTSWLALVKENSQVVIEDVIYVLILAVIWTVARQAMTAYLFLPMFKKSGLSDEVILKAPESAWKFIFYLCTWSYSIYLLFYTKNNFFHDVSSTFVGWNITDSVSTEIFIAYVVQLSFYVHSVYATLFIDLWRKDSVVMLLHHFVTMFLIGFSYAFRYTNVGVLVLFLHDVTDVILEGSKLSVYYKTKGGWWFKICDIISNIGFVLFGVTWYLFRLYWFPLKAMYATGYISKHVKADIIFYHFFNFLLWMLLAMNVYWFTFIIKMAYKLMVNPNNEKLDDIREYEEEKNKKEN